MHEVDGHVDAAKACVMLVYIARATPWRDTVKTFVGPARFCIRSHAFEHHLEFAPTEMLARYSNGQTLADDSLNIIRFGLANAIRQSFELAKRYSAAIGAEAEFRSAPWYHLARLVRNSFSHDFTIDFTLSVTKKERKSGLTEKWLPLQTIQFSNAKFTIDKASHGKELDFDVLPVVYAFELIQMIRDFVQAQTTEPLTQ